MSDRVFGWGKVCAAGSAHESGDAARVRDFALAGQFGRDSIIRAPERQSARAPERQSARAPERQSARAPSHDCAISATRRRFWSLATA